MNFKIRFLLAYIFTSLFESAKFILGNQIGGVGVTAPTALPAQSQKLGFDSELRMKSLLEDIYTDLKGLYNTETKKMSNGIYMEINDAALSNSHTATITMKLHLTGTGVFGNAVAIGHEELPVTKAGTIYRNNCRKVIANPEYGVRQLDEEYLKLRQAHVDDLGAWNKEEEGLEIRQALVEQFGETLRHGDTQAQCIPNFNANIFVAGLTLRDCVPTFSSNPATYTSNIVQKILQSGGGHLDPITAQTLNQPNLSNLSNLAMAKRIGTLKIPGLPGGKGYILTISELQATYLGDPVWSARNLGSLYIAFNRLNEKVQNWTGVVGAYKDMIIVVDPRMPTILPTGSSAPYSATAGYMYWGDTDGRNRSHEHVRDCCILHGQGAVWKWYPQKIHFIEQMDDYDAIKGIGTACVRGIGSMMYDQQTPGTGTMEQFSSILGLCSLPDYV
jgi:hypothetical protein